jgi:transposase, IS30 family
MRGMRKRRFKHITYEERVRIDTLIRAGKSLREIGKALGRKHTAIAYELKHKKVKGLYIPRKAQHKTYWRRYLSKKGCMAVTQSTEVHKFVLEKVESRWSPERISGYLERHSITVSTKAIYKFVHSRSLERYLFWHRNHVRGGPKRKTTKQAGDGRRYIEKRPQLKGSGHFEADFIVSSHNTASLLVLVDRWTRETSVVMVPDRKHHRVTVALGRLLGRYKRVRTLTLDNDIAFGCWRQMEKRFRLKVYFAHPYHSWEKGLVENTNRWIRTFVPKRSDLALVSDEKCAEIERYLNEIPRQCLGYRTANEMRML